jgi:hypothetical protein
MNREAKAFNFVADVRNTISKILSSTKMEMVMRLISLGSIFFRMFLSGSATQIYKKPAIK